MFPRLAVAVAATLATLTFASSAFAITASPGSQTLQYGKPKATITIGDVAGGAEVLIRLVRANGVVVQDWLTGPGTFSWGGKRIGTDTVLVCPDSGHDGVCDGPSASATVTWTQYPAIATYKNATSNMARAIFSNGVDMQFTMNAVCDPGGAFDPRQVFLTMHWTDAGGSHRFSADYASTESCTANAFGGYNLDLYGWGRDKDGTEYPFKIIISTTSDPAHPANLRFGIGNAPGGLDWDFLDGVLQAGVLNRLPGA